ncbi:MAG TPA: BON domain-containing protein [Pirellulales bacterium]
MQRMTRRLAIVAIAALWPAIAAAADPEAAQRIASALRTSGQFVDYSIGVKFDNGTAWLMGRVANDEQRQLAISLVEQMDGVSSVVDKLEIKSSRASADTGVRFAAAQTPACPTNCKPQRAANSRTAADTLAPQSYNDPGDPLQSQGARFAPSNSRRFAPEPNYRVTGAQRATRSPMDSQVRQVSQETEYDNEFQGGPGRGVAPSPPMSFGVQRPGSYRLAGPAPVNTQATPAGYNVSRTAGPMYGPTLGGGCVGGPCVGGNCAVPPYEQPRMPCYSWPSYAAYPNYAGVTYPRQYSPTAWPYIGPFYPYPQVPLGWRKVCLEWDDGWWWLDFYDNHHHH